MEATARTTPKEPYQHSDKEIVPVHPFSQEWVTITKEEHIDLIQRASYREAQHAQIKQKLDRAQEENRYKDAKIKDLQKRLFGKKSEKQTSAKSEKSDKPTATRKRGQQPGTVTDMGAPRGRISPLSLKCATCRKTKNAARVAAYPICPNRDWMRRAKSSRSM